MDKNVPKKDLATRVIYYLIDDHDAVEFTEDFLTHKNYSFDKAFSSDDATILFVVHKMPSSDLKLIHEFTDAICYVDTLDIDL